MNAVSLRIACNELLSTVPHCSAVGGGLTLIPLLAKLSIQIRRLFAIGYNVNHNNSTQY